MVYSKIISEMFFRLEHEGNLLISSFKKIDELLSDKYKVNELEQQIKYTEELYHSFNTIQEELINLVNSTHHNKLSKLVSGSNDINLIKQLNDLKRLLYDVAIQARNTNELLSLCQKLNNNHMNLLFGKNQTPTNYNFNQNNINKHLFTKNKIT